MIRPSFIALLMTGSALAIGTTACGTGDTGNSASEAAEATHAGINLAAIDKSVKPGDDFFAFANGNWVKNTEIPADRSSIGGFTIADKVREDQSRKLIDSIVNSDPKAGSNEALIKNFYQAYANTDAIDRAGMAPVKPDLEAIYRIPDKRALAQAIGASLRADVDPLNATNFQTDHLFGVFVTQGLNTPGETLPYLLQGGLGMPEREYYLSSDAKMAGLRDKYRQYVTSIMKAAGSPDPEAAAKRIIDLETGIARAHATREESEDFTKTGGVWTRAELEKNAPGLDWGALLNAAQLGNAPKFQMYHRDAVTRLAKLVGSAPLESWKDWLAFHQINEFANVLPKPIRDASFAFNSTAVLGTPQPRPRDVQALNAVGDQLPDAVGRAYVDKYFPAEAKADIQRMAGEIKDAFARRVEAIDWMAPSTKQEALKKVETIVVGVGYPDTWRSYQGLNLSPTNAYANAKAVKQAEYRHQLAKIGKPMDRNEWWMPPQLVNAVNLPVQNALNFPAAILVPPFYDAKADKAFNYGAIGAVIGHEISHSFDNNGAAFDSTGNMRNWWTPSDLSRFETAGKALANQYDQYKPFPDLSINGKLTLGENIADVAGLSAAYDAYRHSLDGKDAPVIDGYTGDQRFFIAYAQSWASKMREETMRARIAGDGHAPGQYRALTVRNLDPWYAAFNVKPGDKLYLPPEKRVKIW